MITEKELSQAIRECQAEPITGNKRETLADLFIIKDHLFPGPALSGYSAARSPEKITLETNGGSDFLRIVDGKDAAKVLSVLNELLEALEILHPRLYDGTLSKLNNL